MIQPNCEMCYDFEEEVSGADAVVAEAVRCGGTSTVEAQQPSNGQGSRDDPMVL